MANSLYNEDMLLDGNIAVKQEPMSMDSMPMLATASVPIPQRRAQELSELRDFGFELEQSNSPHLQYNGTVLNSSSLPIPTGFYQAFSPNAMWSPKEDPDCRLVSFRMDDDDIFQVDKADLIQGPTLAELNANDDTLLEDLNFDDLLLPEENSLYINSNNSGLQLRFQNPTMILNNFNSQSLHNNSPSPGNMMGSSSFPQANYYRDNFEVSSSPVEVNLYGNKILGAPFSPESQHSSSSSLLMQPVSPVTTSPGTSSLQQKHSTLHELLLKKEAFSATSSNDRQLLGQSVPGPSSPITNYTATSPGTSGFSRPGRPMPTSSRLSSSAPTHLGHEQIWQRREPRQHLLSTGSLAEAGSTSSLSTGGVLSPEAHDFSHDEGFDSEDDTDHSDDYSTDNETDNDENYGPPVPKLTLSMSKKERYFWQYNVQAKGPKGQRLVLKTRLEDPHVLHEVTDPVFSPHCSVRGIKHSGKARKGDGNDLTPNPKKLFSIGKELDKLGRVINDMTPVNELPFNARPKTRKEKNKLASRACRLKKKAQHEANKLKLYGLEHEHRRLINGISQIKQVIAAKLQSEQACQEELNQHMDSIVTTATRVQVAGFSTDYVNSILDKVKNGVPNGGLDDI